MARKTISAEHEMSVANALGGHRSPSSGAQWNGKGDVVAYPFLISCKATQKKSISLSLKDWEEIWDQAYERGGEPAMALRFVDERGNVVRDLIVLDLDYLGDKRYQWT